MRVSTPQLKGSVLVFSLLVLSMLLSIAVSGSAIVVATKQSARSTEKSGLSFQIADGAAENVLKRIYKNPGDDQDLDEMARNLYKSGDDPTCRDGVISGTLPSSSGTYQVAFLKNDGSRINCSDSLWRAQLVHLKSSGTYAGTTRTLDVGVTPL